MKDTGLRRNQELVRTRLSRPTNHALCRSNMNHWHIQIALFSKIQKLRHTTTLGVDQEFRIRILRKLLIHNIRDYARMNMAFPRPNLHLSARPLLHKRTQEKIRKKQNLSIPRNTIHNLHRITGSADIIALSLNLGSRVNVRNNNSVRMILLPSPQLLPIDRRRQRTTRTKIRQQHRLLRRDYRGRLCHEMNPTKNNHVRRSSSRSLREA